MIDIDPNEIMTYLTNQLDEEKQLNFENRLKASAELRAALADYRLFYQGFEAMKIAEKKDQFAAWSQEDSTTQLEDDQIEQELIAWYFNSNMEESLKISFEQRIAKDPEFAEKVAAYRPIFEGFEAMQMEELESKVRGWANEDKGGEAVSDSPAQAKPKAQSSGKARKGSFIGLGIAAVLNVAMLFFVFQWWKGGDDLTAFVDSHYESLVDPTERGSSNSNDRDFYTMGLEQFKINMNEAAIAAFEKVSPSDSMYLQSLNNIGHMYYELGNYTEASNYFLSVIEVFGTQKYNEKGLYKNNVRWIYLMSLSQQYLKSQQLADQKKLISEIEKFENELSENSSFRKDIKALKKRIQ